MKRPLILISNDDGIRSEGIKTLRAALEKLGVVYTVAPDREQSAASHSLTLHRPLRVEKIALREYAVDGTPTDCVTLAINKILPQRPTIIVSGINKGGNLGEDISYSGTVSAAMEGTLLGIPSIAVSLVSRERFDFRGAARFAARLTGLVLVKGLPKDTLLNVNVPAVKRLKGARITHQGKRIFGDVVFEKVDPRGKKYFWIGGDMLRWEGGQDTDFAAVTKGCISITPVHLDSTNYSAIDELKRWKFS
ncbi:MAG: 5'/3'-nucleotidase SurE [Deltaproteobacteria bacterium]|nr:5'/3'-nucleotidase SurE [Deltaproteobacteria bacterium]